MIMTTPEITYTWKIERIDCAPIEGQLTDVVRKIHWRLFANDGINTLDLFGDISLETPSPAQFTPFSRLRKFMVLRWVEAKINARAQLPGSEEPSVAQLYEGLAGMLAAKRIPSVRPLPIPWRDDDPLENTK
jgi:hypothetical protein